MIFELRWSIKLLMLVLKNIKQKIKIFHFRITRKLEEKRWYYAV